MPQLAHCIKVVLNDVSTKSLQQEEVLHTSGHAPISLSPTPDQHDSSYTSESEAPKMVAKVIVNIDRKTGQSGWLCVLTENGQQSGFILMCCSPA